MIVQIKRVVEGALVTMLLASLLPAAQAQNRRPNGNRLISNALSAAPRRLARNATVAVFQRERSPAHRPTGDKWPHLPAR